MATSLLSSARTVLKVHEGSYSLLFGVMVFAFIYSNSESGFMVINLVSLLMTGQMLNLAVRPRAEATWSSASSSRRRSGSRATRSGVSSGAVDTSDGPAGR